MATNAELSRLLAEVASTGDPFAETSRLVVEVVSEYLPDDALLYGSFDNTGNGLVGTLEDATSAGVHELYLCVASDLALTPPPPALPPGSGGGSGGGWGGGGGGGSGDSGGGGGGGPPGVDPPPGFTQLAEVVHEQYLMVLSSEQVDRQRRHIWVTT